MDTDLAAFETCAYETVARFPTAFQAAASEVVIRVVDWPPQEMLDELEITHREELTGLYQGIPMTEKSISDQPYVPDMVWLFREPILREWRDRRTVPLQELIAHVTVHEFAHHFGWSDDDIATIDRWWE